MNNEHIGQFAILRSPLALVGFNSIELEDGWVLSCQKRLKMYRCPENGFILLGYAWQVLDDRDDPKTELSKLRRDAEPDEIMAMESSWCGRYLLICGTRIYVDTSTLLPIFYSEIGLSSDIFLLAETLGLPLCIYHPGDIMNWMPGPRTHYDEIRKLLPSQIYDYISGEVIGRQLLPEDYISETDARKIVSKFTEVFANSLKNLWNMFPDRKFLIALTGGYDSRTLFSEAVFAGLPFTAFTLERDDNSRGDSETPMRICDCLDIDYVYIPRDHNLYSAHLEKTYIQHTCGMVKDEDRLFYSYGQYQKLEEMFGDIVILRGAIWENVTEFFSKVFPDGDPHPDFCDHFNLRYNSVERLSINEYFKWTEELPQRGLLNSNTFYWEQREGCWLPPMEQGFDLLDKTLAFQPLNCRLLIAMLLDFPREERLNKKHEALITEYACPEISDIPYGGMKVNKEDAVSFIKRKTLRLLDSIHKIGLRKTFRKYSYYYIVRKIMKD